MYFDIHANSHLIYLLSNSITEAVRYSHTRCAYSFSQVHVQLQACPLASYGSTSCRCGLVAPCSSSPLLGEHKRPPGSLWRHQGDFFIALSLPTSALSCARPWQAARHPCCHSLAAAAQPVDRQGNKQTTHQITVHQHNTLSKLANNKLPILHTVKTRLFCLTFRSTTS